MAAGLLTLTAILSSLGGLTVIAAVASAILPTHLTAGYRGSAPGDSPTPRATTSATPAAIRCTCSHSMTSAPGIAGHHHHSPIRPTRGTGQVAASVRTPAPGRHSRNPSPLGSRAHATGPPSTH